MEYYFNDTDLRNRLVQLGNLSKLSGDPREKSSLEEFHEAYAKLHGYISVFVCLFGVVANIANIVVLTRKNMITTTNIVLTGLAVTDTLKMIDYLPFVVYFYILKDPALPHFSTKSLNWMLYLLFHASFSIICHTCAIWMTIVLAIFRFLMIWFPTSGTTWCTHYRAKVVICFVIVSVIGICTPNLVINTWTIEVKNSTGNNSQQVIYHSDFRQGGVFRYVTNINFYIQAILVKLVPCFTLTIFTFLLIYAMHKAHKKRISLMSEGKKEESDRHHEHNRTTGMLLAVVVLFLFTELPQGMLTLLIIFKPNLQNSVYDPLGDVLDIVALCNNAINFVLYCSMSKMFRDTFVAIFCKCCPKQRPSGWAKTKLVKNGGQKNYNSTVHENDIKTTFV